ncbi:MAG: hypothetical protein HUJ54_03230 [Erysipelotrichaceae bacterium]|nr:hypothetical protein [Erysipelotrichaceae bacterium]
MKICLWIDSFFDSYELRRSWLKAFVLGFAFLSLCRMAPLFYAMAQTDSSDRLLELQGALSRYESLFIIRFLFKTIHSASVHPLQIFGAFVSSVSAWSWIFFAACLFLYYTSGHKRRILKAAGAFLLGCGGIGLWLLTALQARSLDEVARTVQGAGWAGLFFCVVGLFVLGWTFGLILVNISKRV